MVTVAGVLSICLAQKRTMTKQKTFGGMRPSACVCVRVHVRACVEGPACPFRCAAPRSLILLARRKCGRNRKDFRFVIRSAQRDLENWIRKYTRAPVTGLKSENRHTLTNTYIYARID